MEPLVAIFEMSKLYLVLEAELSGVSLLQDKFSRAEAYIIWDDVLDLF